MNTNSLKSFKCLEHYESPVKSSFHSLNPLIRLDIPFKKGPYLCCNTHEAEFEESFSSDSDCSVLSENIETLVFLNSQSEMLSMNNKDEAGTQYTEGPPVSLKLLSYSTISPNTYKTLTPNKVSFSILHDPVIILPRQSKLSNIQDDDDDDGAFQCKFCFKIFLTGQALGGHMSRKHPVNKGS